MLLQELTAFCKDIRSLYRVAATALLVCCSCITAYTQDCPNNIDFETGTFDGWVCYTGTCASVNDQNIISINPGSPAFNRHTMYTYSPTGKELDPYGNFPVICPNGSNHSIRLGNDQGGGEAEGISYEFTIPLNMDVYSLIYHYAVVFQDPNHLESQQPRMEVEITNVTDNQRIDCSSFTFHPYGSVLPGFQLSANPGSNTPVWFKDWSAVSINLNNMAGKTIRMFFKTADCTFKKHFGYAYIDVNSECSGEFTGAAYCPDDTAVNVIAPYGYEKYTWYNSAFTQVLGNGQVLTMRPPPIAGTRLAVELVPFNGYGCLDTLYAKLVDTLTVYAHAGPDALSCNREPVQIGIRPKPGISYRWTPTAGLSDPFISNPLATPNITTTYILTASSSGGGCATTDTVVVIADVVSDSMRLVGDASYCITSGDSAVLLVQPTENIQWYKDNFPIINSNTPDYKVRESGTYYAVLKNNDGCGVTTAKQTIFIDVPKPGITYQVKYALSDVAIPLQARPIGKTAVWQPGAFLNDTTRFSPTFAGAEDELYKVTITTAAGCITTDTQFVKIVSHVDIYVPTAFTPDGDGKNDILRPMLRGVKDLHYFKVFNRFGQLLFQTNREWEGWDGRINGNPQQTQTVVWVVEATGVDNKAFKKTGATVLVR